MRYLLAFLIPFLLSASVQADEISVGYGLGVGPSAALHMAETKTAQLTYRTGESVYGQIKLGYYGDGSGNPSRLSSGFASAGFGLRVDLHPIEIRSGYGVGFITTPDSYLGGRLPQFNGDLYLGVRDKHGAGIGVQYDHISSAGLVSPNVGRDFVTLQLSGRFSL